MLFKNLQLTPIIISVTMTLSSCNGPDKRLGQEPVASHKASEEYLSAMKNPALHYIKDDPASALIRFSTGNDPLAEFFSLRKNEELLITSGYGLGSGSRTQSASMEINVSRISVTSKVSTIDNY